MLLVGAMCLSMVSVVSAKSYDIRIPAPLTAGSVQLPAGDYNLKVDGTNAILTSVDHNKTYTTAVKVETAEKKFAQTSVLTDNSNGASRIKAINLGGSTTTLEFGQ